MNIQLRRPVQLTGLSQDWCFVLGLLTALQPILAEGFHVFELWFVCVVCSLALSFFGSNTSETAGYTLLQRRIPSDLFAGNLTDFSRLSAFHLAPSMSVLASVVVYCINLVNIPTDCPAHGAFPAADVSGLHLSGHGGFPKQWAPANS